MRIAGHATTVLDRPPVLISPTMDATTADLRALVEGHEPASPREARPRRTSWPSCPSCRHRATNTPVRPTSPLRASSSGPRGTVLHLHKRLGIWMQPGGHIDAGETPDDGGAARGDRGARPGGRAPGSRSAPHPPRRARGRTRPHPPRPALPPDRARRRPAPAAGREPRRPLVRLGRGAWPWPTPRWSTRCRWPGPPTRRLAWPDASDTSTHLLAVQDLDTSITQLQHRRDALAETSGLAAVEAELAALEAERADAAAPAERAWRRRRRASRSRSPAHRAARRHREAPVRRDRLVGSRPAGHERRGQHLTERRAELEEQELVAMLEPGSDRRRARARCASGMAPLEAQADELRAQVGAGAPRARCRDRRPPPGRVPPRRPSCPTALSDRYETLRTRLKGTGAARLIGSHCDGCHLELSSVEVERIRALPPGEVATCEQCGRILVPDLRSSTPDADPGPPRRIGGQRARPAAGTHRRRADRDRPGSGGGGPSLLERPWPRCARARSRRARRHRRAARPRACRSQSTSAGSRSTTASSSASRWATFLPRSGRRWQRDRDFRPDGGESLAEVDVRIAGACEELFATDGCGARRADGDVVVVSHVTPIKAAVAWALGTPDLYWRLHLRTASVTRIGWNRDAPDPARVQRGGVGARRGGGTPQSRRA